MCNFVRNTLFNVGSQLLLSLLAVEVNWLNNNGRAMKKDTSLNKYKIFNNTRDEIEKHKHA